MTATKSGVDYGIDAPNVLRNLLLIGVLGLVLSVVGPRQVRLGPVVVLLHATFFWAGLLLTMQGLLYLLYVKWGKMRHRDWMLSMVTWRGSERVLDVGCGRGLLLVGAAKRLDALGGTGTATGIDIWSQVDMGGNSEAATRKNLELEGVSGRCELIGMGAEAMRFADGSFEVVVSNLCLHNIPAKEDRRRAVMEIARVLTPGGVALLSDYKNTGEYLGWLKEMGLTVERRWGSLATTFPPLRLVVARKG